MENNNSHNRLTRLVMNPYFIITLGVFLFYGRLLLGDMPYTGDFLTYQLPEKTLIRECYLQGIIPFINPYILSSTPMLANIATGSLYPLNFLLLIGTPVFGFNLFLFIHVLLAGWSMCLFIHRGLELNKHISGLAGVSYSLGGCLWGMIDKGFIVSPWLIPLFFLGLIYFFDHRKRNKYGWLLGVGSLTFLFYSGNLLETYFTILVAGAGIIWWAVFCSNGVKIEWQKAFSPFGKYLVLVLTAILLASPQLVPTFQASLISCRSLGVSVTDAQHWSFPFIRTIEYFIPFAFGAREAGGSYYGNLYVNNPLHNSGGSPWFDCVFLGFPMGSSVIFFLIISVSNFIKQRRKEDCRICQSFFQNQDLVLIAGLFFFFVLALGKATPLYQLCYATLPGFKVFRHPEKFIEWVNIFLLIIGAYGLQKLCLINKDEILRVFRLIVLTILSILFGVLVVSLVLFLVKTEKYSLFFQGYGSQWNGERIFLWQAGSLIVSIISLTLMFVCVRLYREQPHKIIIVFIWISLMNFVFWSYRVDWTVPVKTFVSAETWDKLLPDFDKRKFRLYAATQFKYMSSSPKLAIYTGLEDNAASLAHLHIPSGFSALLEQKYVDFFNFEKHSALKLMDILSVKYIASPKLQGNKIPDNCKILKIGSENQYMILENTTAIPRYSLYKEFRKIDAEDEMKNFFAVREGNSSFVLNELPANFQEDLVLGENPKIKMIQDLPGKITFEITDGPCWLILRDWYSPGWACLDNQGEKVPIISVEGGLMGVFVSGKKTVLNFSYYPPGFNFGLLLAVFGIVLLLLGFGINLQYLKKVERKI